MLCGTAKRTRAVRNEMHCVRRIDERRVYISDLIKGDRFLRRRTRTTSIAIGPMHSSSSYRLRSLEGSMVAAASTTILKERKRKVRTFHEARQIVSRRQCRD